MKKNKFSWIKNIKRDERGWVDDERYEELTILIGDAIDDEDTPEWKRKLAFAVDKELYAEEYKELEEEE